MVKNYSINSGEFIPECAQILFVSFFQMTQVYRRAVSIALAFTLGLWVGGAMTLMVQSFEKPQKKEP